MLLLVFIPFYRMMTKDRKARAAQDNVRQDKYIEREKEIISVITANTEAITGLKATLELTSTSTISSFARIHERMDSNSEKMNEHGEGITRIQTKLEEMIRKQHTVSEDIKRGFSEIRQKKRDRSDQHGNKL
jgi:glyceraldehyde-3-phosphate dehydrogenase/erythrose-4-phosphate dehydrogenase